MQYATLSWLWLSCIGSVWIVSLSLSIDMIGYVEFGYSVSNCFVAVVRSATNLKGLPKWEGLFAIWLLQTG